MYLFLLIGRMRMHQIPVNTWLYTFLPSAIGARANSSRTYLQSELQEKSKTSWNSNGYGSEHCLRFGAGIGSSFMASQSTTANRQHSEHLTPTILSLAK
jgi:hypothetical protein